MIRGASVLTDEPPQVALPMPGEEQPERPFAEQQIHPAGVGTRIGQRGKSRHPTSTGVVDAAPILRPVGAQRVELGESRRRIASL